MTVDAVIEMPSNVTYKYEMDKNTGELLLDRPLQLQVPFNYGFVPGTLCDDGDPLDIFVASAHPIVPMARVKAKVIGMFKCIDNGKGDDKLVSVLIGEHPNLDADTEAGIVDLVEYYLKNYKAGFEIISYSRGAPLITWKPVWEP